MTLLFEIFCLGLFYSIVCRAVHVNKSVLVRVRIALMVLAAATSYSMYLPWTGAWEPDRLHVIFVGAVWFYLAAFGKTWPRSGKPPRHMLRQPQAVHNQNYNGPDRRSLV